MTILILVVLEFIVGLAIGFFLCDKEEGLSINEMKLGSLVFLVANAFVLYQNPSMNLVILGHLAISWFILTIGLFSGEALRLQIVKNIINAIHKKDVQLAVSNFIQAAMKLPYCNCEARDSNREAMVKSLTAVQKEMDGLIRKANLLGETAVATKFTSIKELCITFANLSEHVNRQNNVEIRNAVTKKWLAISDELNHLSWDTLNHAEENVRKQLKKGFGLSMMTIKG